MTMGSRRRRLWVGEDVGEEVGCRALLLFDHFSHLNEWMGRRVLLLNHLQKCGAELLLFDASHLGYEVHSTLQVRPFL